MQISEHAVGLDGCVVSAVDPARVESVAEMLLDVDAAGDLAEMFRLLGDPTRVRILFALLEAGELCVCDIAAVVETSETKVSQAMRLLRSAGVVRRLIVQSHEGDLNAFTFSSMRFNRPLPASRWNLQTPRGTRRL